MPHIHADYQGQVAVYSIHDGTVLTDELPLKKHELVVAWTEIHYDDYLADRHLAVNGKKFFPILALDQGTLQGLFRRMIASCASHPTMKEKAFLT